MALKDFRVSGMIRNKSLEKDGRGGQVESWKGVHAKWQGKRRQADESGDRSAIRKKSDLQQGTLEEIKAVQRCVEKGCLVDPMPMEDMYINTCMAQSRDRRVPD